MDRVFELGRLESASAPAPETHVEPVDVAIHEPKPAASPAPIPDPASNNTPPWLIPCLTGISVAGVLGSGWLIGHWQSALVQLEQERQLLKLERLRQQPSSNTAPSQGADKAAAMTPLGPQPNQHSGRAAPPPPQRDWVASLEPLTLPIRQLPPNPQPQSAATKAGISPHSSDDPAAIEDVIPQLTGVVYGPHGSSSAIFQLGRSSLTAGLGEVIGGSDWVLESVSETGAVIRRNGQQRSLSVGGMF